MKPKKKVWLIQQGVWTTPLESMPLAAGYLKATILADPLLARELDVRIFSFRGGENLRASLKSLLFDSTPDVVAMSVFGWNVQSFGILSETYRQLAPDGWIVWGGTHVSYQAARFFRLVPEVDVIVDGEGEFAFRELLLSYLAGTSRHELDHIRGISFKGTDGQLRSTPARERIQNLDDIPSPFLTGALEMTLPSGQFRYDVALMETNRGCPYQCSFCYWGGAIGQKVRSFSRERLREELEFFAFHKVETVVLCDANFGMLKQDLDFVEDLLAVRDRTGYPRYLESSWAKNKSQTFYQLVRRMKQAGLRSSFTLALQSLQEETLRTMRRQNMKVNEWEELVDWLVAEGLDCYGEMIWGAPGETVRSFLEGYDRLAARVPRIATYPLLLMPNTHYSNSRQEFGFVTIRNAKDDFEHVLASATVSVDDNRRMHHFLFWARVIAENMVLRQVWQPLRVLAGLRQSEVLLSLDRFFSASTEPFAERVRSARALVVDNLDASQISDGLRLFYVGSVVDEALAGWWTQEIDPRLPTETRSLLGEIFRFDLLTRAIYDPAGSPIGEDLPVTTIRDCDYYVRSGQSFSFEIPRAVPELLRGGGITASEEPWTPTLYYRTGFAVHLDNHESVPRFVGRTWDQLEEEWQLLVLPRTADSSGQAAGAFS